MKNGCRPLWLEKDRLSALERYNILDTPQEQDFDDIAQLAAQICNVPISLVNFLADHRQFFKARVGTDLTGTPRDVAICNHAILQRDVFIVPDTTQDDRFKDNPLVTGDPRLRFYAGALLETPEGLPIGTMCVLDYKPRQLSEKEAFALRTLARQVMIQLELRRTVREQRKTEASLRSLMDAIPDCVEVLSLGGEIEWMSANGQRLMQVENFAALRRRSWPESWQGAEVVAAARHALAEAGSGREYRFRGLCQTGREAARWWDVMVAPILDATGAPESILSISRDVTTLKQAEDAVAESREQLRTHAETLEHRVKERTAQLQDMLEELEAFSYSISHDLRAPLRAMQSFAECLAEECGALVTPDGRDYIRRIVNATGRMDRLIQDILIYSQAVRADVRIEPIDADKLLREVTESDFHFHLTGATIEFLDPVPRVMANESLLIQCFTNLMTNAIKFVAPGIQPRVRIASQIEQGRARIAIQDNGIGIDTDNHEQIFRLFHQVNPRTGSTGIGLAVARKAAERMGGTLRVESTPGTGSTFIIELQAA